MLKLGYRVGLRKVLRTRRSAGLQLEPPKPGVRRRGRTTSLNQGEATRPNQVWSWDFVMLRTRKGRALPENIRSDNGSEFNAEAVRGFIAEQGIKAIYIDPGCPWQSGYVESINSRFRGECLKSEQFYSGHSQSKGSRAPARQSDCPRLTTP
jgi:transposase InsO family protein